MAGIQKHIKVIISGGGTGGHIYPAIAIADALKAADPACEILFVGANGRMEMEKVPEAGYRIIGLDISGIQRKSLIKNLGFPIKLFRSLWKARSIIKEFRPDVAVGVGGYASGPLLFAASLMGVKTLLQEQNGYAGLTNKLLAGRANKICVAYPNMGRYFPEKKTVFTGNPLRKSLLVKNIAEGEAESFFGFKTGSGKKTLLVIGGSLGALTLNKALMAGYAKLAENGIRIVWQTGKGFFEKTDAAFKNGLPENVKMMPFISRMDLAYSIADLVVSRAGALSVSELCLAGKPVILVPSPNVAEDHQTKNALNLTEAGAAVLIKDAEAEAKLVDEILKLMPDATRLASLSKNILTLAKPKAAEEIAEIIISC